MRAIKIVPNMLVFVRLIAAFMVPYHAIAHEWVLAFVWGVGGFLTDLIDGPIARRYDAETRFGKVVDPVADVVFDIGVIIGAIIGGFIGGLMTAYLIVSAVLLRLPAYFTDPKSVPYKLGFISGVPYAICIVIFVVWPYLSAGLGSYLYHFLVISSPVIIFVIWQKRERMATDKRKLVAVIRKAAGR